MAIVGTMPIHFTLLKYGKNAAFTAFKRYEKYSGFWNCRCTNVMAHVTPVPFLSCAVGFLVESYLNFEKINPRRDAFDNNIEKSQNRC